MMLFIIIYDYDKVKKKFQKNILKKYLKLIIKYFFACKRRKNLCRENFLWQASLICHTFVIFFIQKIAINTKIKLGFITQKGNWNIFFYINVINIYRYFSKTSLWTNCISLNILSQLDTLLLDHFFSKSCILKNNIFIADSLLGNAPLP